MQVRSEREAYNPYKLYALKRGFSIQKAVKREYNGVIRQREFVCLNKVVKYQNLDVRTGYCTRIQFDVKNDIWSVHTLMTHNHEFATLEERCNLRLGRKVLPAHGNIISTMVSSSIKAKKSYFLSKELGGANSVGFSIFLLILFPLFFRAL